MKNKNNSNLLENKIQEVEILHKILKNTPELPEGFDAWIYRGTNYRSNGAIMNSSICVDDTILEWDEPAMFETKGLINTHYIEAIIFHHPICKCNSCEK